LLDDGTTLRSGLICDPTTGPSLTGSSAGTTIGGGFFGIMVLSFFLLIIFSLAADKLPLTVLSFFGTIATG
jgi:hypothetical protein